MTVASPKVTSRWKAVAFGLCFVLVGLVVQDGADRKIVDASKPLPGGGPTVPIRTPRILKLGSFNIHSGKGTDGIRDLSRTDHLLNGIDFVGLYEVRSMADASQPNQAAALANQHGGAWVFAPAERQWWTDHFGNGLISYIPVRSAVRIPLVNTRGKAYRNAVLATVKLDGADVRIIAVHIDREDDRVRQLQTVIDLFLSLQPPCVLMGDLNTPETDPLLVKLRERPDVRSPLHDSLESGPPARIIDWVFTRGLKTISAALVENSASDHPFLRAELEPMDEQ